MHSRILLVIIFIHSLSFSQLVSDDYIDIYQNTLSDLRNNSCPMYPSCSEYGREEFRTKPALIAAASTADRLMRCGHEHDFYPVSISEKGYGLLDLNESKSDSTHNLYEPNRFFTSYNDLLPDSEEEKFIKRLINEQLHEYALYELLKLEFTQGKLTEEMFINRIICYEAQEEYEKAIFNRHVDYSVLSSDILSYHMARIYYGIGNTTYLEEIDVLKINDGLSKRRIMAIQLASELKSEGIKPTITRARLLKNEGLEEGILEQFIENGQNAKYKSRTVAGFMSIVPGLGYIYAGHNRTGLSSLIINSVLAYTAIESFKNNNVGVGVLSSLFGVSFYLGNLSGAKKSVDRFNEKINRDLIKSLEKNF
jgi:putative component of membrane protein insertase Oxa1/YidC/SpoIIIJ protein YidD